jgi:uncharacterized protein YndB with AHSA1/START domain
VKLQRTVSTPASPEAVFAYLSDFTHTEEWDPGTVRTERVSGDGGVGTTYHNVSTFNGRETELRYEVTDFRPDTTFALRGENKTVVAHDTMEITPTTGAGTQVTYTAEFEFKGLAKLAVPFIGGAMKKLGDEAEQGLRDALAKL